MSRVRADRFTDRAGTGSPTVQNGLVVTGIVTATTFSGDATGLSGTPSITVQDAIIQGDLTVNGTQTILNTSELYIEDKTVGIASTASTTDAYADGAGIVIFGDTEKTITYNDTKKAFETNIPIATNETRVLTISEKTVRVNGNTVDLIYNSNGSNIGLATNPSGNIALNVTGIPTTSDFDNHILTFSVFVVQSGTERLCNSITLNGVSRTINWAGGSLTAARLGVSTSNGYDIYSFTAINTSGSASTTSNYAVLGVVNGGYGVY